MEYWQNKRLKVSISVYWIGWINGWIAAVFYLTLCVTMIGEYINDQVIVESGKGTVLNAIGSTGPRVYLLPEEALYLIQKSCLLLIKNNIICSLNQSHHLLIGDLACQVKYHEYQVSVGWVVVGWLVVVVKLSSSLITEALPFSSHSH